MKNLRIAKKDPSKILKIIQNPQAHRYNSHIDTAKINQIAVASSKSKEAKKNILTYREQSSIQSPSRSQHIVDFSFTTKNKKIRSKSLNQSQDTIKSQEKTPFNFIMRNSLEMKMKNQFKNYSPYIQLHTFRDSQKLQKFQSINIENKQYRKEENESKGISKNTSRTKTLNYRADHSRQQLQSIRKKSNETIETARLLLSQGQYRKSLLIIKSLLKTQPDMIEALYLSALNWFHLDDRPKTILYLQKIIQYDHSYSAECYKILAVCHFKSMEYNRSLAMLKECHNYFVEQSQSYQLQGKIYLKMSKWKAAIDSYIKAYQITSNLDHLVIIGSCLQQLKRFQQALTYYDRASNGIQTYPKLILKKMRIYIKLAKYQTILKLFNDCDGDNQSFESPKDKSQIYYLTAYSYYKLKNYPPAIPLIEEGLKMSDSQSRFKKLLLMIKIDERCIYDAFHLVGSMQKEPQLRVMIKFIEGVISLMRRNYNEGIAILLSIQNQLGFKLQTSRFSNKSSLSSYEQHRKNINNQHHDQFLNQIRKIYLMFLSYGYYSMGEFHSCKKLISLQRQIGVPFYFESGLNYNYYMCEGILSHLEKKFKHAEQSFLKAKQIYGARLQPPFSLALNYLQLMVYAASENEKAQMIKRAKDQFTQCKKQLAKGCSNTAASVFYFYSLLNASLEQWKQALVNIDQSINLSEDHYWRYYYIRGMYLACVHSFRQAINDLSIAVTLSANSKPECFLLRSRCYQIEGDGNQAFKDLQQYISMKPDDPEVHKYAGQLLFQNGAFEDALTAFSHQNIPQVISNYDIFMTEGKSLFLLGRFKQAQMAMKRGYNLNKNKEVLFDMKIFDILQAIIKKIENPLSIRNRLETLYKDFGCLGKIFKKTDYNVLRAVCFVQERQFKEAIQSFSMSISQKNIQTQKCQNQEEIISFQNEKDIQMFTSQMRYNIVICHLAQGNMEKAVEVTQTIHVDLDQPYYADYVNFKRFVSREVQNLKKNEVFPSKNKLSNYLQKIYYSITSKESQKKLQCQIKLCIPFPKVQPPEIFPVFDQILLTKLSVLNVDRKPQAPWIIRENNSIKFTSKIETFSNFLLEDSQNQSQSTYQMISVDNSHVHRYSSRHFNKSKTSRPKIQQSALIT